MTQALYFWCAKRDERNWTSPLQKEFFERMRDDISFGYDIQTGKVFPYTDMCIGRDEMLDRCDGFYSAVVKRPEFFIDLIKDGQPVEIDTGEIGVLYGQDVAEKVRKLQDNPFRLKLVCR